MNTHKRTSSRRPVGPSAQLALLEKAEKGSLAAFRVGWTAFMVLATSLPYVLYWLSTPPGFCYTWILPPYPVDSFAYMAWSQQAAHGSLLFQLKYTAMPHAAFLFQPFFLLCGWLSVVSGCDVGVVHWAVKAVGVVLFLVTFFSYLDYLKLSRIQFIAASVLTGISSGAGGLLGWLGREDLVKTIRPVDTWVTDANTYWALLWNPLFPYSLTLLLLAIYWLDRGTRDGRNSDLWRSGLASGGLVLIHPYSQPLLAALLIAFSLLRRKADALGYLWRYFLAVLPFIFWVAATAISNPIVSLHNAIGEMKSSSVTSYLAGFGLTLLLCAAGLYVGRGHMFKRCWQFIVWFTLSVALSYLPFWFQRKLIFGAHIPLCIVGGIAFDAIMAKWFGPRTRPWAMAASALVLLPVMASTQLYNLAAENSAIKVNKGSAYYISNDTIRGLKFLKDAGSPRDIVFASLATSSFIPAFSGNTVVWGHWAMSVDFKERQKWFASISSTSSNWSDDRRCREFWGAGIEYIFADGDFYQALKGPVWPWGAILAEAEKAFENGSVMIFRHRGPHG